MAYNPFAVDNSGSQSYADLLGGLGRDVTKDAPGAGLAGIAKYANPITAGIGAATSIIDTITNIYATHEMKKEMEKNRQMATKQYEEQKAIEAEKEAYGRGIAERSWNYTVKQTAFAQAEQKRQDNYRKWTDFVGRFTGYMNQNNDFRQNMINNYRANARLA